MLRSVQLNDGSGPLSAGKGALFPLGNKVIATKDGKTVKVVD